MQSLDISLDFSSIQHVSLKDALGIGLLTKESPINKFFQTYMDAQGDDYGTKFKLVIYAGSEMIGPSIQVAELAGCITESLITDRKYTKGRPFLFLDIFSGSSSTTIPSLHRFRGKKCYIKVDRVDSSRPDVNEDYLVKLFGNNVKLLKYKEIDVFQKIREGKSDYIFGKRKSPYDLCIADPPHFLTLDFLIAKKNAESKSIGDMLKQRVNVFILYYAHKEQKNLCTRVRSELAKYYRYVWRVIVGSEEMAVCYNMPQYNDSVIPTALDKFKFLYRDKYDKKGKLPIYCELKESCKE